jgi:hypothetical protein
VRYSSRVKRALPDGLYEHLITTELAEALASLEAARSAHIEQLSDDDIQGVLARHVGREVERILGSLPREERAEAARVVVEHLLNALGSIAAERGLEVDALAEQHVSPPPRRLLALHRARELERPSSPLALSTLLTRNAAEPAIGHELACEIASADRIDAVVAFVTMGGIRRIREQLVAHRGDRPIGITWRLEHPMPAALFESYATLASG